MSIFNPAMLGCPVCTPPGSLHGLQTRTFFTTTPAGLLLCSRGHEFSLYQSLKVQTTFGRDGILSVFAHEQRAVLGPATAGKIVALRIAEISGFQPFALIVHDTNPFMHNHVAVLEEGQTIVATSAKIGDAPSVAPWNLFGAVYFYRTEQNVLWYQILYDALTDFSQNRGRSAIIKLGAAIDQFADHIFERYLKQNRHLAEVVIQGIVQSARNWEDRIKRIQGLAGVLLPAEDQNRLRAARKPYERKVRGLRNEAAHPTRGDLEVEQVEAAFEAAFDIMWTFDRLDATIPPCRCA